MYVWLGGGTLSGHCRLTALQAIQNHLALRHAALVPETVPPYPRGAEALCLQQCQQLHTHRRPGVGRALWSRPLESRMLVCQIDVPVSDTEFLATSSRFLGGVCSALEANMLVPGK